MKSAMICGALLLFTYGEIGAAQTEYTFHTIGFESTAIDLAEDGTLLFSSPHDQGIRKYFVREPGDNIRELPFPDGTYSPTGINSHGTIVGNRYAVETLSSPGVFHLPIGAFLRGSDGEIAEFRIPGATRTLAQDVNDRGDIAGGYRVTPLDATWPYGFTNVDLGYVHNEVTGKTKTFADSEGAISIRAITEQGKVIGRFEENIKLEGAYSVHQDFSLRESSRLTPFDCERGKLFSFDFNDVDQAILYCVDSSSFGHFGSFAVEQISYVQDEGIQHAIGHPGSNLTRLTSINNSGTLAGTAYVGNASYAFVATVPEPSNRTSWPLLVLLAISTRKRRQ